MKDVKSVRDRIAIKACEGISVEALEAGVVQRAIEAFKAIETAPLSRGMVDIGTYACRMAGTICAMLEPKNEKEPPDVV